MVSQVHDLLLAKRVLSLGDNIDEKTSDRIREGLVILSDRSKSEEVKLLIDSNGGNANCALAICDAIRLLSMDVTGIVSGKCASSAVAVMMTCVKRIATPNSWFYLHYTETTCKVAIDADFEETVRAAVSYASNVQERYEQVISTGCGLPRERIHELVDRGARYNERLNAKQAHEIGLIHEIVEKYDIM